MQRDGVTSDPNSSKSGSVPWPRPRDPAVAQGLIPALPAGGDPSERNVHQPWAAKEVLASGGRATPRYGQPFANFCRKQVKSKMLSVGGSMLPSQLAYGSAAA